MPLRPTPWHRAGLRSAVRSVSGVGRSLPRSTVFRLPGCRLPLLARSPLAASLSPASLPANRKPAARQPASRPPLVLPPKWVDASSFGRLPTRPLFAEIQYRGQRPSICESEKRDASGCLRKVLRLPRSVFSRSSCPKLTPHISTVFVHREEEVEKMAMQERHHIPSWHTPGVGASGRAIHLAFEGDARARLGYTSR